MAMIPRGPRASERRAEMMRHAWGRVEKHGSAVLNPVWAFLTAHPTLTQGAYYLVFGLWPLLSMSSFVQVTGPKTDLWLVDTVAALIAVVGGTLCLAAYRRRLSPEVACLALGCACVFAIVDLVFVTQRVISPVYLLDAAAEVGLLAVWAYAWGKGRLTWTDVRSAPPPVAVPLAPMNGVPPGRG